MINIIKIEYEVMIFLNDYIFLIWVKLGYWDPESS